MSLTYDDAAVAEAEQWLVALRNQIGKSVRDPSSGHRWWRTERSLTDMEWNRVQELIRTLELPCDIEFIWHHSSLRIYWHTHIPQARPTSILWIEGPQLPFSKDSMPYDKRQALELKAFAELAGTDRNREILEWYGIEPSHYLERLVRNAA